MKLLKLFSGNSRARTRQFIFSGLIFFCLPSHALHQDFENKNYVRPTVTAIGALAGLYILSEQDNGPIIFGTVYTIGALYLVNERFTYEQDLNRLMVPLSLFGLSVLNFALLESDDYSKNDVFVYNTVGLALVTAYAIWDHSKPNSHFAVYPYTKANELGAILDVRF